MTRFLAILSILFISSCTEVMVVLPEPAVIESEKVVLVEELTGVSCPNCPAGAAQLASIIERYGDNVIGVSIHGEFLSDPLSISQFDFGSELADDIEEYLQPYFGKPAAAINRIQYEGEFEFASSSLELWPQLVEAELEKQQEADVFISHEYDPASRALTIDVEVEPLIDLSGDIRISVMLLESHIIDAQLDQSEVIEDYEHNHMLQDMLTAFDGDPLTSEISAFEKVTRSYSYTLPVEQGLWIAENMDIVAFITKVTPTSKEVIQAAEVHIIE